MSVDLSTRYLGLDLKNPCVLAASPLTARLSSLRRFEEAGAAAAVLPSLFQDQVEMQQADQDPCYECRSDVPLDKLSFFDDMKEHNRGPDGYLAMIQRAKEAISIPLIGSLNATQPGEWTAFSRSIQSAGVDALELNIYFIPVDPWQTARDVENRYLDTISSVISHVSIPVSVKLGAYFTSLPHFVRQLSEIGTAGVVLFNRYLEPDVDVDAHRIWPRLDLSHHSENRLPFRWVGLLSDQIDIDYAITSGIHSSLDVVKSVMVGANAVMMASALLQHGPSRLVKILDEIEGWLVDHDLESIAQIKGQLTHGAYAEASRDERGHYLEALVAGAMTWRAAP